MKTTTINVDFSNENISPILSFIEDTQKGSFTNGIEINTFNSIENYEINSIGNIIHEDYHIIYGVSY